MTQQYRRHNRQNRSNNATTIIFTPPISLRSIVGKTHLPYCGERQKITLNLHQRARWRRHTSDGRYRSRRRPKHTQPNGGAREGSNRTSGLSAVGKTTPSECRRVRLIGTMAVTKERQRNADDAITTPLAFGVVGGELGRSLSLPSSRRVRMLSHPHYIGGLVITTVHINRRGSS